MEPTQQQIVDAFLEQIRTNTVLRRAIHIESGPDTIDDEPATIAFSTAEGESVFVAITVE